ncbi:MAG TPA: methylated-DNA--[protein]-cysteine methyltransferase [Ruminiclostridium sp.]|jgi:methylated-DNA-[protein]-cysteine S-methyltransferase|nr:methylated-DNA--[protein]-cysteine methyltransferase [Ruminiclostridium sp.]
MKKLYFYQTGIGKIGIAENQGSITDIFFGSEKVPRDILLEETSLLREAAGQLQEYFLGKLRRFDLPLSPEGTAFQKSVWRALCEIPYGETRTYGEIAREIGNKRACRAVGMANNKNPAVIVIPCHRVIGANGKLVGYGGGLDMKAYLLNLEKKVLGADLI